MKSSATSLQRLDSESRLRIRIFALKLLVLGWAAAVMAALRGYPGLALVSAFCLGRPSLPPWRRSFVATNSAPLI
jgi:hypothetical protein